jgi:citrate synthase
MALLTATQTAQRLGIKLNTVYAYVSRGLLEKRAAVDGTSRFDSRQVEQLARRGRPRLSSQESSINLLIESGLTSLSEGGVAYRGHSTRELIRTYTFEEVAELLWVGDLRKIGNRWRSSPLELPESAKALFTEHQIRILTAQMPVNSHGWNTPAPEEVAAIGRAVITSVVEALPKVGAKSSVKLRLGTRRVPGSLATRLWPVLSEKPATSELIHLLNAALILLADHELATSTFAVRVAASTRAAPSAALLAGLGAMQGPLHGGASRLARELVVDAMDRGAATAVQDRISRGERLGGFGHRVYAGADPRATLLLELLRDAIPRSRALVIVDDLVREVRLRIRKEPNVDLALALMELGADLQPHSAETIFTVARMAGWLAHVIEEYNQPPLRFRARAYYTGPR